MAWKPLRHYINGNIGLQFQPVDATLSIRSDILEDTPLLRPFKAMWSNCVHGPDGQLVYPPLQILVAWYIIEMTELGE